MGRQAFQAGDIAMALSFCSGRLAEAPNDTDALELKSVILQAKGDLPGAEKAMREALRFDPACAWALNDLTDLLHRSGQKAAAEIAARAAVKVLPDDAQAHMQLAVILGDKDDLPAAEFHNRRALALAGPHPQILINLGLCLYNQGRIDEALTVLLQAHKAQPDAAMTMAHISRAHEAKRDMTEAFAWLARAEKTGQDFTLLRAQYLSNAGQPQAALDLIEASKSTLAGPAMLDRARLLDKLGRYDEAWSGFITAKARLSQEMGLNYNAARVVADFAALKAKPVSIRKAGRASGPQPIFILGFPRSGTTLIEQVLNAHPQIAAGGELPFVHEWQGLPNTSPEALRDHYLMRARTYGVIGAQPFFTDKMPLNDVSLPLIRQAFPESPVIRLVRHPLDVATSMLSHNLTHGYNCGYKIETVIAHMVAMHDLNSHYDRMLDAAVFTLKYEDFVADQAGETRRLLGHVGVVYDPACLKFHENQRHAPTPSYAQVTQPLNDRSVGRWRAYSAQFAPFMEQIAPVITALGYDL